MAGSSSSRLVGRGSIYTLASAGPMLAGVLVTPVLARALSVAEYGVVSLAIVTMQFVVGLLALGLPLVITRHAFSERTAEVGARSLAVTGAVIVLGLAAVAALAAAAVAALFDLDPAPAFLLAVVAGGAGAGVAMAQAWAVAQDRSAFYVLLAFAVGLVAPAAGVIAVLLGGRGATTYFLASGAVFVATDLAAIAWLTARGSLAPSRTELASSLRIGLPLVPHQLAVSSATGASVLVAGTVLGVSASAHTQIGVYLGTVPLVVTSALAYAWTPIILAAPADEVGPRLTETARTVAWLAACGGSFIAMLSPWLLRLVTSVDYDREAIVPITAGVALVSAVSVVFLAHSQLVVSTGRTGSFGWMSPLALLLGTCAAVLLVSWWGLAAGGLGYLVTYVLLGFFARLLARRRSAVRWNEGVMVPPLVLAAVCCAAGAWLPASGSGIVVRLVAAAVLAILGARLLLAAVGTKKEAR